MESETPEPGKYLYNGLGRLPFHTITLFCLVFGVILGYIDIEGAEILVGALAGAIFSPFFNGLADLGRLAFNKLLSSIDEATPSKVGFVLHILSILGIVVVIIYLFFIYGIETETGLAVAFLLIMIFQTFVYHDQNFD